MGHHCHGVHHNSEPNALDVLRSARYLLKNKYFPQPFCLCCPPIKIYRFISGRSCRIILRHSPPGGQELEKIITR